MKLVLCAYCYHEVEQTKDGTCPFCGGNLAHDPIEEPDEERLSRIKTVVRQITGEQPEEQRIPDFEIIIPDEPWEMIGTGKSYLARELAKIYGVGGVPEEVAKLAYSESEQPEPEESDHADAEEYHSQEKARLWFDESRYRADQEKHDLRKMKLDSAVIKDLTKCLQPWYKSEWIPIICKFAGLLLVIVSMAVLSAQVSLYPSDSLDLSVIFELVFALILVLSVMVMIYYIKRLDD